MGIGKKVIMLLMVVLVLVMGMMSFGSVARGATNWVLTWSDEFDGSGAPNANKWDRPSYNRRNNPSGPDGYWDPNYAYLDGSGHCVIKVDEVANRNGDGDAYDYAVGAIRTYGKFTQLYGRYEMRAQMPQQQGWWVAFWMMQGNQGSIGNGGVDGSEVDIMEGWGWTDKINHAIHWDGYGASHQSVGHNETISGIRSGYHAFTLDWMPDIYIFYVDGVEQWRSTGGGICNQPGYIKVTGEISTEAWAITDSWSRDPAGATYPDYYIIDYVRVYQDGGTATATPSPTASPTATPTATTSATPTPTVTPTAGGSGNDEFSSGTLGSMWSWIREDAANWSLTARTGYMRLICTSTDIYSTNNTGKNILLQTPATGDFSIVTKLDGKPSSDWAQAGLVVYQNDDNYVKLTRLYDSANGGNVFQFTKETGAVPTSYYATDSIGSTVSYLKITKSGNSYSCYYSADSSSYNQIGTTQTVALSGIKVGLLCIAGTGLNGDFDYFRYDNAATPTSTITPTSTVTPTPTPTSSVIATATPTPTGGSVLFQSGLETGDTQPTWSDTTDGISGVTAYPGASGPECAIRQETAHAGVKALMYSGHDNSTSTSYCKYKVFDVNIPITSATKMSFWIYPQQDMGRYVSIDYVNTDGTSLRDSGATDYNGYSMHPNQGHGGNITLNAWTQVKCNVGQWLNGKTIDRIIVNYDRPALTGDYRGYIDDILITNGTLP